MSFRLPEAQEKAAYVQNQFDRIAARYDLTNDFISMRMHRAWKAKAVDSLQCLPEGRYLDVCCGTGDLGLRIAQHLGKNGSVTGLDFSENMLAVAQARESAARSRLTCSKLEWIQGDAQQLPFQDDSFDGAIISFGLRNLTDLQRGVSEMSRVVKPGGKVVNLDLGHPTVPLFTPLYLFYFFHVVPLIGLLLQGDRNAYTYLPESMKAYPKPTGISSIFEKAGLKDVKHNPLAMGTVALHVGTVY
jgi:demethylmenaquinone methyltransferase / 2-methoxy-6-polyprenyl-1,4-benzoquinol methylase